MLALIIGGSASGKSEFAENMAIELGEKRLYIATMQPFDDECLKRIEKHHIMRQDKGFTTRELYSGFGIAKFDDSADVVLLECMSNLLANEMYNENSSADPVTDILCRIINLMSSYKNIVIVSNEVFCDGDSYTEDTLLYIKRLGKINREIAKLADTVVELVSGIPVYHKIPHIIG